MLRIYLNSEERTNLKKKIDSVLKIEPQYYEKREDFNRLKFELYKHPRVSNRVEAYDFTHWIDDRSKFFSDYMDESKSWWNRLFIWADWYSVSESVLPRNKQNLCELEELDISVLRDRKNKTKSGGIPKEISNLTNLRMLILQSDLFTSFPVELYELNKLEHLSITETQIKGFPKGLASLKELKYLCISSNELERVPEDIRYLSKLETLWLGGRGFTKANNFIEIPQFIWNMDNLKVLEFSSGYYNKFAIDVVPHEIINLINVESIMTDSIIEDDLIVSLNKLTKLGYLSCKIRNEESLDKFKISGIKLNKYCIQIESSSELHYKT